MAGLLRGAPYEYLVYSVPPVESRSRFEEAWEPLPPILISGSSRESAEFAARRRIGLGLAFTNLAAAKPSAQHYFQQAAEQGWQPEPDQVIYGHLPVYLADTDEAASKLAHPRVEASHLAPGMLRANRLVAESGFFGSQNPELLKRFQTMGSPRHRSPWRPSWSWEHCSVALAKRSSSSCVTFGMSSAPGSSA